MRLFGILFGLAVAFAAVTLCLMAVTPLGTVELISLIAIAAAIANRLVLARIAPHWSNHRAIMISALVFPLLAWLIAFGFDLSVVIGRELYGDRSRMGGFIIVLFRPCVSGFLWGLAAAFAVTKLRKLGPQR